jgi:hypothetical protein
MDFNELIKIKPFIVHGTDQSNILSILESGLLNSKELKDKDIPSIKQDPLVQINNNKLDSISVWVYDTNKESYDVERKGAFKCGTLTENEREELIRKTNFLESPNYDFCFIINPDFGYELPKKKPFPYEAFVNSLGKISSKNVVAVVTDRSMLIKNLRYQEGETEESAKIKMDSFLKKVEEELSKRGIPFIDTGWKESVQE